MQPDWVWIKQRANDNYSHELFDVVRGVTKYIVSDTNVAEATGSTTLTSFDSNGFTLGADTIVNKNSKTYVAWNWKAGTSFTNDASSTGIGSIDSSGSANDTAGFSIVSWTGTGSAGTIKHGLSNEVRMIIIKNLNSAEAWPVYHAGNTSAPATEQIYLNLTNATSDGSSHWNDTAPTSSIFTVGSSTEANKSSSPMIAYCFAEKQGYSKFGSYTGNGNVNGPMIFTGHSPAFVILKRTNSSNHWIMFDNKRDPHNEAIGVLYPSQSASEDRGTGANDIDFLANGFKIKEDNGECNGSGDSYIYMSFAQNPFTTSSGVPATAR